MLLVHVVQCTYLFLQCFVILVTTSVFYSELQTYITSLILQKKLIFTASYDVYKHFYSGYLALILW